MHLNILRGKVEGLYIYFHPNGICIAKGNDFLRGPAWGPWDTQKVGCGGTTVLVRLPSNRGGPRLLTNRRPDQRRAKMGRASASITVLGLLQGLLTFIKQGKRSQRRVRPWVSTRARDRRDVSSRWQPCSKDSVTARAKRGRFTIPRILVYWGWGRVVRGRGGRVSVACQRFSLELG